MYHELERIDWSDPELAARLLLASRLPGSAETEHWPPRVAGPWGNVPSLPQSSPSRNGGAAATRRGPKPDRPNPRWLPSMPEPEAWSPGGNLSLREVRDPAANAYRLFKIDVGRGTHPLESAGWASNAEIESHGKHTSRQRPGPGRGIYHWGHPNPQQDRRIAFKKVNRHPIEGSTEEAQLNFRDWELRNGYARVRQLLDSALARRDQPPTAGEMAEIIMRTFESPHEQGRNGIDRRNIANELIRMSRPQR